MEVHRGGGANPCHGCDNCCRYVSIELDTPKNVDDYDEIYWLLLHENIHVYIDPDGSWWAEIKTRCKNLEEKRCAAYEERPIMCEEYDPGECVREGDSHNEEWYFSSAEEYLAYLKEHGLHYEPRHVVAKRKQR